MRSVIGIVVGVVILSMVIGCGGRPPAEKEIRAFRKVVESGTADEIENALKENPKLLNAPHPKYRWTPLHAAAGANGLTAAKLLVGRGANLEARVLTGETPLHTAAGFGYVDMVEFLIKSGADVNAKAGDGVTPLDLVLSSGGGRKEFKKVAELLRKHGGKRWQEIAR